MSGTRKKVSGSPALQIVGQRMGMQSSLNSSEIVIFLFVFNFALN